MLLLAPAPTTAPPPTTAKKYYWEAAFTVGPSDAGSYGIGNLNSATAANFWLGDGLDTIGVWTDAVYWNGDYIYTSPDHSTWILGFGTPALGESICQELDAEGLIFKFRVGATGAWVVVDLSTLVGQTITSAPVVAAISGYTSPAQQVSITGRFAVNSWQGVPEDGFVEEPHSTTWNPAHSSPDTRFSADKLTITGGGVTGAAAGYMNSFSKIPYKYYWETLFTSNGSYTVGIGIGNAQSSTLSNYYVGVGADTFGLWEDGYYWDGQYAPEPIFDPNGVDVLICHEFDEAAMLYKYRLGTTGAWRTFDLSAPAFAGQTITEQPVAPAYTATGLSPGKIAIRPAASSWQGVPEDGFIESFYWHVWDRMHCSVADVIFIDDLTVTCTSPNYVPGYSDSPVIGSPPIVRAVPAFVQGAESPSSTTVNASCTLPAPVGAGNYLVVICGSQDGGETISSVFDDKGNLYTMLNMELINKTPESPDPPDVAYCYIAGPINNGPTTLVCQHLTGTQWPYIQACEYHNIEQHPNAMDAVDGHASLTLYHVVGTDSGQSGAITTTTDGALICGVCATRGYTGGNQAPPAGSGFTSRIRSGAYATSEDHLQTEHGQIQATFSPTGDTRIASFVVALKALILSGGP